MIGPCTSFMANRTNFKTSHFGSVADNKTITEWNDGVAYVGMMIIPVFRL